MDRRRFLAYGSVVTVGLAGCLGQSSESPAGTDSTAATTDEPGTTAAASSDSTSTPPTSGSTSSLATVGGSGSPSSTASGTTATESTDGYPPSGTEPSTERDIDTGSFDTVDRNGVAVPLAPVDVTHYWHQRRGARFADARGQGQYETAHIQGAVLSPATGDSTGDDPVLDWPKGDRIVCYCGCPHHLSSIRAADLLSRGYENVYVIDEGVREWQDRGYPMAGSEPGNQPAVRVIEGRAAAEFAGESAWASHRASGQREATAIEADGSYTLELKFADLTPDSPIQVRTPGYTVERSLESLTGTILTG